MAKGLFITFEGTEGCGKSTQIDLLARQLRELGYRVRTLREPGGTPIGEEIRHTLKHSQHNHAMFAETELLLMNASRAQIVREVIRPALDAGEIVLCDRFYDSTTAYQGYGRQLDLEMVRRVIDIAVGDLRPDLTLLLTISQEISELRRAMRQSTLPFVRDRIGGGGPEIFRARGQRLRRHRRRRAETLSHFERRKFRREQSAPKSGSWSSRFCRRRKIGRW